MSSTFTSHQKSTSPKSTLSLSLNCFKFSHNSQIKFDNYFDAHSKYPLTNTSNKLSDNYKIHQKLSKHEKIHQILARLPPTHYHHPTQIHPSIKPLNNYHYTTNQLRKHLSTPNSPQNHTTHIKITSTKIRPEFKIPVLNHIVQFLKIPTIKGYFQRKHKSIIFQIISKLNHFTEVISSA